MTLVVDTSVALRWFFDLPGSDRAEAILRDGEALIAPDLVIAEIANAAWKLVVSDGVPVAVVEAVVRNAERPFVELVPAAQLKDRAVAIALELRHPVYDCLYVALAEARATRVVTADARLIRRVRQTTFEALVAPL